MISKSMMFEGFEAGKSISHFDLRQVVSEKSKNGTIVIERK